MKIPKMLALAVAVAATGALAGDWVLEYHSARVRYAIYGGGLGDPVAPSGREAKVAFEVEGDAAKNLFESMGPDKMEHCSSEPGVRYRSKNDDKLACMVTGNRHYACYFGFDLKSGKSVGGSIC